MSTIPTKQIDGDVAVGRNVSAGGNANIQGNARVGHDLVVEGWLEAKNIKSANKGLFATVDALRAAYPHVHEGWFAGVPATDKEISDLGLSVEEGKALYRMYIGCGGEWVCEPLNKLYEITVDNRLVEIFREELTTLRDDHDHLEARVEAAETKMSDVDTRLTAEETRSQEKDEELAASLANETSRAGVAEQLLNDRIAQLKDALDTLDHENATEAIESFREILAFLEGISDDETLLAKLTEIKSLINSVAANTSRTDQQLSSAITSETNRAKTTERELGERIDGLNTELGAAIDSEKSRAEQAETKLGDEVLAESIRAQKAETELGKRIDQHDDTLDTIDESIIALSGRVNAHQRKFMQVDGKFATEQGLFTHLSRTPNPDLRPECGAIVEANIGDVWQLWQYRYNMLDFEQLLDTQSEQLPDAQAQEHGEGDVEATALPPVAPDLNIANASNWVRLATIDDTERVFIDMWVEAAGDYGGYDATYTEDGKSKPYELNDLHFDYDEAVAIMGFARERGQRVIITEWGRGQLARCHNRTMLPIMLNGSNTMMYELCEGCDCEVLQFEMLHEAGKAISFWYTFYNCKRLREIRGTISIAERSFNVNNNASFGLCSSLEEVRLKGYAGGYLNLSESPLLSLESMQFLVSNALTLTEAATIMVHADVYAKLTDTTNSAWYKVLTDAAAKKITFATS